MYVNGLSDNFISIAKLFADDISIIYITNNINDVTEEISNDLNRISYLLYQWRIMFNPDITKQAQKSIFFSKNVPQKIVKCFHPTAFLNKVPV